MILEKNKNNRESPSNLLLCFYENNDKNALSIFFLQFQDLAFRIAFNVLRNEADAEDIVQQTFHQIIQKQAICKAAFEQNDLKVRSWLLTIIYNASRMQYNSRKRKQTTELDKGVDVAIHQNVSEDLEKDALLKKVDKALAGLPEKYRIPILMKYHEDMPISEICKILSSRPGTIRSILSRGITLLKNKLSDEKTLLSSTILIDAIAGIPYPELKNTLTIETINKIKTTNPFVKKAIAQQNINWVNILIIPFVTIIAISIGAYLFAPHIFDYSHKIANYVVKTNPTPIEENKKIIWDFSKQDDTGISYVRNKMKHDTINGTLSNISPDGKAENTAYALFDFKITQAIKISITEKTIMFFDGSYQSLEMILFDNKDFLSENRLYHRLRSVDRNLENKPFQNNLIFYIFDNYQVITSEDGRTRKITSYPKNVLNTTLGFLASNVYIEKIEIEPLNTKELNQIKQKVHEILNTKNKK